MRRVLGWGFEFFVLGVLGYDVGLMKLQIQVPRGTRRHFFTQEPVLHH